jgi:hypothetical protein
VSEATPDPEQRPRPDLPASGAPTEPIGTGADAAEPGADASARRARLVIVVSLAVLAVAGLLLAFFVGTRLRGAPAPAPAPSSASASPSAAPTPTPTPTVAPAGTVPPGTYAWDALGGGECVDPYVSPWEREFTVVECGQPHPAQVVARGSFSGDAAAAYPGEQTLTAQLNLLCTAPEVLDRGAAGQYADLQFQASYPAGEQQWVAGDRGYFCFVSRSSGEALTGSLAVPR